MLKYSLMPIYDYACKKCEHEFEALVQGRSKPDCPKCGSKSLEKLISGFSAHKPEPGLVPLNQVRGCKPSG